MSVTSFPESRIIWLWIIKPATWRILSSGKHCSRQTIRETRKHVTAGGVVCFSFYKESKDFET
jgi:hypothetical protein